MISRPPLVFTALFGVLNYIRRSWNLMSYSRRTSPHWGRNCPNSASLLVYPVLAGPANPWIGKEQPMVGSHTRLSDTNVKEIAPIYSKYLVSPDRYGLYLPTHQPHLSLCYAVSAPRQELSCLVLQAMVRNEGLQSPPISGPSLV